MGELAVSRSFGDKNYKDYITVEPEVEAFEFCEDYDYLVMAIDKLWNVSFFLVFFVKILFNYLSLFFKNYKQN